MNFEKIKKFQTQQKEIVAGIGAFLTILNSYSELLSLHEFESNELIHIRRLQPIVGEFCNYTEKIHNFLNDYHYVAYNQPISRSAHQMAALLANQTMPSQKIAIEKFEETFINQKDLISEGMIAIAQLFSSPIDLNIKASDSFTAYCFLASLLDTTSQELIIIDPYVDQSLFYRYLYRLRNNVRIIVITDTNKLKNDRLLKYESVEELFSKEYLKYERRMLTDLHDRYIINETYAYTLGGSIKDAAIKSDYSIVQLENTMRKEIIEKYIKS